MICAEGLSVLLHHAQLEGALSRVKNFQAAPSISHLFFADDSVIFLKEKQEEAAALKQVLELYENCLGQCINRKKSALMFSPNTVAEERSNVKQSLQIHSESWNNKYLGLPVHVGRSRKNARECSRCL